MIWNLSYKNVSSTVNVNKGKTNWTEHGMTHIYTHAYMWLGPTGGAEKEVNIMNLYTKCSNKNIFTNQSTEFRSSVSPDTSTKQFPHKRFRNHCGRCSGKAVRPREDFAVRSCLLQMSEATCMKSPQHDCYLNVSGIRTIAVNKLK